MPEAERGGEDTSAKIDRMSVNSSFLLILSEREAIRWVLANGRMAFSAMKRREFAELAAGDQLLIVTTRGAYHNPGRDRARVVGLATVTSQVQELPEPVELAGRVFPRGCEVRISALAPYPSGAELAPMVKALETFRGLRGWAVLLRRPLLRVSASDARTLTRAARPYFGDLDKALASYMHLRPVRR